MQGAVLCQDAAAAGCPWPVSTYTTVQTGKERKADAEISRKTQGTMTVSQLENKIFLACYYAEPLCLKK